MIEINELQINLNFWQNEDNTKINVLKLLLAGYSNNCIANELNFSLKNIESIISKLFRRCGIITRGGNASYINPRVKLFVDGLIKNWLRYKIEEKSCSIDFLSRNHYLSLLLCAGGCSNKAIADFLCISPKTVESRLNSLFHQFAVNIQLDNQINPRMKLITNALIKRVISYESIKNTAQVLNPDNWTEIIKNREEIKNELLKYQLEQPIQENKSHLIQTDTNVNSALDHLLSNQNATMPQNIMIKRNSMSPEEILKAALAKSEELKNEQAKQQAQQNYTF